MVPRYGSWLNTKTARVYLQYAHHFTSTSLSDFLYNKTYLDSDLDLIFRYYYCVRT